MASISVPIEKPYGYNDGYSRSPGLGGAGNVGLGGGAFQGGIGPPYIVKLLNLPVTANDAFVQDLFQSRFTPFVKFKILTDPSSNILETHIIKQVAFVELESAQDAQKALKWHDLYYKGTRRVIVEVADFNDFRHCIQFNQEHADEIHRIQQEFLLQKQQLRQPRHMALLDELDKRGPRAGFSAVHGHGYQQHQHQHQHQYPSSHNQPPAHYNQHQYPLRDIGGPRSPERTYNSSHHLQNQSFDTQFPAHKPGLAQPTLSQLHDKTQLNSHTSTEAHKSKPNPFGAAKPVDTVTKQIEIEKKLINLNKTTVQTLGDDSDIDVESTIKQFHESALHPRRESFNRRMSNERRHSVSILRRQSQESAPATNQHQNHSQTAHSNNGGEKQSETTAKYTAAPSPRNEFIANGTGKSLAQLLSEQSDLVTKSSGKSTPKNITPKPATAKPVILKKKSVLSPQPQKLEINSQDGNITTQKVAEAEKESVSLQKEKQSFTNVDGGNDNSSSLAKIGDARLSTLRKQEDFSKPQKQEGPSWRLRQSGTQGQEKQEQEEQSKELERTQTLSLAEPASDKGQVYHSRKPLRASKSKRGDDDRPNFKNLDFLVQKSTQRKNASTPFHTTKESNLQSNNSSYDTKGSSSFEKQQPTIAGHALQQPFEDDFNLPMQDVDTGSVSNEEHIPRKFRSYQQQLDQSQRQTQLASATPAISSTSFSTLGDTVPNTRAVSAEVTLSNVDNLAANPKSSPTHTEVSTVDRTINTNGEQEHKAGEVDGNFPKTNADSEDKEHLEDANGVPRSPYRGRGRGSGRSRGPGRGRGRGSGIAFDDNIHSNTTGRGGFVRRGSDDQGASTISGEESREVERSNEETWSRGRGSGRGGRGWRGGRGRGRGRTGARGRGRGHGGMGSEGPVTELSTDAGSR